MSTMKTSIAALLRASTSCSPEKMAIVGEGRAITFGDLDARSNALANGLSGLGLKPADRLAYLGRNSTEYWEFFFACAKAGIAISPMNFRLSADEVAWILDDLQPAAVVVEDHLTGLVPQRYGGAQFHFCQEGRPGEVPRGWTAYEEWLADKDTSDTQADVSGDMLLSIMYSSGTTGRPKGVMTTHDAMLWAVDAFGSIFTPTPDSVSLVPTPYYHIAAGGWSLIALGAGGTIVQFTEVTPQNMLGLLVAHRATHVIMVPTVIQAFLASPQAAALDYSSVEYLVYGGSPISETVMLGAQKMFDAKLAQSYGLTETIGVLCVLAPEDHVAGPDSKLLSAGRPVAGSDVEIRDPASGEKVEGGVVGEVCVRGPQVTVGYWRRPEDTAAAFWPGGWFRTGDAGYRDADGYVFLKDRIKDMLVSGGENVYPAEVENVLMAHPAIAEVAVIGVPSGKWGETPLAVVTLKPGTSATEAEIIDFTRERLAHYKCPTSVRFVLSLPRNPSGKVLKRELRAQEWAGHRRSIG